jgi:hypothetical protein
VAYRAEIEISVKGARQLREVTGQIEQLAERVDLVSAYFKPFIQTLDQFESNLSRTATTLRRVTAGTDNEVTAIKQYVQALGEANTARARQNNLIQQELALQEAAKRKTEPGSTGFSRAQYGPALPPAFIKQQEDQQNFKRLFADLNETAKVISVSNTNTKTSWRKAFEELNETAKAISVNRLNTQTSWRKAFEELNETAKAISVNRLNTQTSWQKAFEELNETAKAISVNRLNTQTSWRKTFEELNETAKAISVNRLNTQTSWRKAFEELNETAKAISVSRLNVKNSWVKALSDLEEVATEISKAAERERRQTRNRARRGTVAAGRERQKRTRDATSNAIIGGAFPLLFGQGAGASVGGAAGGALGGLAGGQFGFGLSLVGTALGTAFDTLVAKAASIGQAFTKTGVDADALANAIGDLSGSTKKLIEETKDVSGSQAAAEAAAKLMAASIGEDAVDALVKLGDATNDLSSAAAILNTEFAALAAELLGPVAAGIAGLLERTNLINAAARFRKEGGVNADRIGAAGERGFKEGGQQGAIDAQIEEAGKIVIEQRREAAKFITDANIENSKTLEILVAEGQILDINKNLLDSKTLQITKGNIALKYAAELEKEGLTPLEKKVIEQKKLNELKSIDNKVTEQQQAANRKAEADAKKAQQEVQRAQRELEARNRGISSAKVGSMQALIAGSSAGLQSTRVFKGEKAFLDESEKALEYEVRLKTRILDIQYKQQASQAKSQEEAEHLFNTYNTQYDTIERIYFTQLQQVRQQKEQLRVQKEINALQQAEETAGITRGFTRNIADVERRIASPFGGDDSDMLNLRIEQLRRTEDIYRDIDTQVSILNKQLEADPSNEIIADNIKGLEERRQKLEALLPVLDQVEQAELRQNQLMEKYGFIANEAATAMSSAVQSIVTGTGSVQEAFSNMFANIGKAFIDMATQMIAKALIMKAIGILTSAFGGGSSPGIQRALDVTPKTGAAATSTLNNFLSFRANGGPVSSNTPYIVGERGPELMVPSTSGMVLSNSETRQQLTQQGSAMRSTEATRQQLNTQRNTMITNSTRETERMTEMMLSNPDPIDVRYESTVINNVEYVTAEQHRQGMAQAAERGRSLTLSALQGSVKTRKKVGLS